MVMSRKSKQKVSAFALLAFFDVVNPYPIPAPELSRKGGWLYQAKVALAKNRNAFWVS